jgi:hypothetical protein
MPCGMAALRSSLTLLAPLVLLACGAETPSNPGDPSTGNKVSALIGPAGGTLISKDGKAKLVVPPGALEIERELTVEPHALDAAVGLPTSGYDFGPDGLEFRVWAELSIENEGVAEAEIEIAKLYDDGTLRSQSSTIDREARRVTAAIPGFSTYGIMYTRVWPPTVAAVQQPSRAIDLTFSWPRGVPTQILIEQATNDRATAHDGEFVQIMEISAVATHRVVPSGAARSYHFRARAKGGAGVSVPSPLVSIFDGGVPSTPGVPGHFTAVAITDTEVQLSWDHVPEAAKYELERRVGAGAWSPLTQVTATNLSDPGLTPETDYAYRIRSVLTAGGNSDWSEASVRTHVAWIRLGGVMNRQPAYNASRPSLATSPTGEIYAAWTEADETDGGVYVDVWDGRSWSPVGTSLGIRPNTALAGKATVKVDSLGRPVVIWSEADVLYAKRWDGASWQQLGGTVLAGSPSDHFAVNYSFAIGRDDAPVVAFGQRQIGTQVQEVYVRRFDGTAWVTIGGAPLSYTDLRGVAEPSLALDASSAPIVAYLEREGGKYEVKVIRWSGSAWAPVGSATPTATDDTGTEPSLTLDASGAPLLAYSREDRANSRTVVTVRRFDSTSWVELPNLNVSAHSSYMAHADLGDDGKIRVAFTEDGASYPTSMIYVREYDGSAWVTVGGEMVAEAEAYLRAPTVITRNGGVVVSWEATTTDGMLSTANTASFGL